MQKMNLIIIGLICLISASACDKGTAGGDKPTGGNLEPSVKKELSFTDIGKLNTKAQNMNSHALDYRRSHLEMIYGTYQQVGSSAGVRWPSYPRINRMDDGTYILTWQNNTASGGNGKDTHYALSKDLKNWDYKGFLFQSRKITSSAGKDAIQQMTNANGIQLSDGRYMAIASFWTPDTYNKESYRKDQGLVIKFTSDHGESWTAEQVIYTGPNWEAHVMETPTGQIQVYFSESRPWISGSHSGTSLIVSDDGGKTWTPSPGQDPWRVMRKKWTDQDAVGGFDWKFTYQMPVGIRLNGMDKMAFSMECVTSRVKGAQTHAISVVYSPDDGKWVHLQGEEIGPTGENLENFLNGTAPYLGQFRSGETVLTYSKSQMKYAIGDAKAGNFSEPVNLFSHNGGWPGFCIDSPHTLVAVDRNASNGNDAATITLAQFYLNHSIRASKRDIQVDADASDWGADDDALYLGAVSNVSAVVRASADAANLYLLMEVKDSELADDDQCCIFLSAEGDNARLGGTSRRIRFNANGLKSIDKYAGGWTKTESAAKAKVAYDGTLNQKDDSDKGYVLEISIPKSELSISDGRLLVNALLFDAVAAREDAIVNSATTDTSTWPAITEL